MKTEMFKYRVTRPAVYGLNTPGHKNVSARQGYYTTAATAETAAQNIREQLQREEPLDVQDWNNGPDNSLVVRYDV